ncbi:MAG: DUF2283 domain-containing protein [Dictyoglomaceae bacterium]|nr:DUF2283 domain-containing protein [Dictyoglomaceae bacterium]
MKWLVIRNGENNMAKEITIEETKEQILKIINFLLTLPQKKMWIDYDDEADVLYISFKRPKKATETKTTKDGILLRYRGNELVRITVLEASNG